MLNNINPNLVNPAGNQGIQPEPTKKTTAGSLSFGQVMEANLAKSGELKFSAHAQARIQSRNIQLSNQDISRLEQGVAQAAAKGSRESLLLKDNLAFVVSVKNNTVITAVDSGSMKGNVFTNIDSAVIV
jgi:flagellar operon protein